MNSLQINIPKRKLRPEEQLHAFIFGLDNNVNGKEIVNELQKAPVWAGNFLTIFIEGKEPLKQLSQGAFKTLYRLENKAIGLEMEKDRKGDTILYAMLKDVKGCPTVMYPTDVWYWQGFKFSMLNYCVDGDLRGIYARLGKLLPIESMLLNIYSVGFTLHQVHLNGIYPTDIKPENILYCSCNGDKYLTLADFEECPIDRDFLIDNEIKKYKRPNGFLTQYGRKLFPFTRGYGFLDRYILFRLPISKMELIYQGWYAYAHTYLEIYSMLSSKRSPNNMTRSSMYAREHGIAVDWRNPVGIDLIKNKFDYLAMKMIDIIRAATKFMNIEGKYKMVNAYKITLDNKLIDIEAWKLFYNNTIKKDFNKDNLSTWEDKLNYRVVI